MLPGKATMTVKEVLDAKRACGIHCSYYEERDALLRGDRPYGTAFHGKGRVVTRIYRVKFAAWLAEYAPEVSV